MDNSQLSTFESVLSAFLPEGELKEKKLIESMRYSLEAGGKRVRPTLVAEFCKLCGGRVESALPFACAVEMIHTYSLIHDDLPCMDDDDLRRGKPSNHKVFGEDTALLAGDALQTLAFEVITSDIACEAVGERACRKAANKLARYAGCVGMVGGQVIDLMSENIRVPVETVYELVYKKTACLIKAACELGCIAAGADDEKIAAASLYGESIGIAFQIQDDILDCTSTNEELGKPVGSDEGNKKSTFVSLLGIKECKKQVEDLTNQALNALESFEGNTAFLRDYALALAKRKN